MLVQTLEQFLAFFLNREGNRRSDPCRSRPRVVFAVAAKLRRSAERENLAAGRYRAARFDRSVAWL